LPAQKGVHDHALPLIEFASGGRRRSDITSSQVGQLRAFGADAFAFYQSQHDRPRRSGVRERRRQAGCARRRGAPAVSLAATRASTVPSFVTSGDFAWFQH
jgi:hypothetical protein